MKKIEVFGSKDQSMLIKIDDLVINLTAEEAAILDSQMAAAYTDYEVLEVEPRRPGQPLDRVRPVTGRNFH